MKQLVVLLLVATALTVMLASVSAEGEEVAARARVAAVRLQCMQDLKVTEDDVKELQDQHQITKDVTKKLTLCLFKAFKIIDDKNKLSKTGALAAAEKAIGEAADKEKKLKVAEEIVDVCEKEVNPQPVAPEETAKLVYDCLKKNIVERKLHEEWKV